MEKDGKHMAAKGQFPIADIVWHEKEATTMYQ
jgi:hypothetical protein